MSGDLKERIEELLRSLGDNPDAVYGELMGRGITGTQDDGTCCPIAQLIRAEVPEANDDESWLHPSDLGQAPGWFVERRQVWTPDGAVLAPAPVSEFIAVFDDGIGIDHDGQPICPYGDLEARR